MEIDKKKILIGAGVLVIGYLAYKKFKGTPNSVVNAVVVPKPLSKEEQEALNEAEEALSDANEAKRIAIEEAKQAIIDAEDRASSLVGRG